MKELVYVSGHRNPDTDSICSAIGYAYLLKALDRYNAIPVRLGEINRETEYVLKRFHIEIPMLLKTVKQKVEDLNYDKVTVFSKELTLKTAWSLMKQQNLKSAPILDDHGQLLGLLSTSNIVEGYMEKWDSSLLKEAHTPIENVIDTLEASILYLNQDLKFIEGDLHIAAMRGEEAKKRIKPGDIVIVGGDREDAVNSMIEADVSLIILTGSLDVDATMLDKLKEKGISVISTPYNTYLTSQQIIQAIPVEYIMQKGDLKLFTTDDTLDHVKEVMSETRYRSYPVLDLNNRCVGSISRFALLKGLRKKVVLVDHNERGQSIPGIDEADILEIVDHHRVADIQTMGPLLFRGEPLGSTATIVTKIFDENDIEIPQSIAGALLGAVISDTLLFKSPTCTEDDKLAAKDLASIANIDVEKYGLEMLKAGTDLSDLTELELINLDAKEVMLKNSKAIIAQVNTASIEDMMKRKDKIEEEMKKVIEEKNLDIFFFAITDIINSNSQAIVLGKKAYITESAYNVKLENNTAFLKGVVSRKKQIIPVLMEQE